MHEQNFSVYGIRKMWHAMNREGFLIALGGAAAQLVDGGIGMGFGVTSTTILLLAGLGPAQASAVVHTAELGTP